MCWSPLPTVTVWVPVGAASRSAVPAWAAAITQSPAWRKVTVVPASLIVHALPVAGARENVTGPPEVLTAVGEYVVPNAGSAGGFDVKVTLWVAFGAVTVWVTVGAA